MQFDTILFMLALGFYKIILHCLKNKLVPLVSTKITQSLKSSQLKTFWLVSY